MFNYTAHVDRVIDGDTVDVSIDLGFDIWHKVRLRLNGLDTPEKNTELGKTVAAFVKSELEGKDIVISTLKPDKYGRYLVEITKDGASFNKMLIDKGYAHPYDGGKKIAWS